MFQRLRGEPFDVVPLVPETGNVWPGPQKPDPTLQELEQEQGNPAAAAAVGPSDRRVPHPQGTAPAVVRPGTPPPLVGPAQQGPGGTSVDVTGGQNIPGYRQLQTPPSGRGILVPNGNGTSTLIGPDGSISTVPSTKP